MESGPHPRRAAPLSTAALLRILRCPRSGQTLHLTSAGSLEAADGDNEYPIVNGIPVLLADERSLFSVSDYLPRGRAATERPKGHVARTIGQLLPAITSHERSVANYRRLRDLVDEMLTDLRCTIVVVGGSLDGAGFDQLLGAKTLLDVIAVDPALGPRTAVVADAHDLPFADAVADVVVCQAVLEHVADPVRVVSQIHRVLKPGGLVYSEIPFMQQVHEGAYDFTRYTLTGHRRLFRSFAEIDAGAVSGPGTALAWSLKYLLRAAGGSRTRLRGALVAGAHLSGFWLKYLDPWLMRTSVGTDGAAGTYFLGRRDTLVATDRDIVARYQGASTAFVYRRP
jgi:SAM-dependent methyltransferase